MPPDEGPWDWTAQIQVKKYELGCSFAVFLFLGGVLEDPARWPLHQEYVGACFELVTKTARIVLTAAGKATMQTNEALLEP
ncbi:hypothetical protein BDZ97DRAFT_1925015 [Flammula alnicola]|nr:hypothetical protein BDZ97DRAFT_1925015 [Flammula alnicola]